MASIMIFPETIDEFIDQYKIVDTERVYTNGSELIPVSSMKQWIDHLPTADVVEVVRCKECKFASFWYADKYLCSEMGIDVSRDGFCSYGERRKEDAEIH